MGDCSHQGFVWQAANLLETRLLFVLIGLIMYLVY